MTPERLKEIEERLGDAAFFWGLKNSHGLFFEEATVDLLAEVKRLRRALIDLTNQVVPLRWQEPAGRFHCTWAEQQALGALDATKPVREEQTNDA